MDGTAYYFKYNGEEDGLRTTTDVNEATIYYVNVQDETNGVFTFQSEDGNYLIFCGRDLSRESDRGYNSGLGYYTTYDAEKCNLTIAPMQTGGQVKSTASEYMTIMGKRYKDKTNSESAGVYDAYFVIKNDGTFDGADTPYFNENYSSAFVFESVSDNDNEGGEDNEEPETPDIPFEGQTFGFTAIDGKIGTKSCAMATFSATVPTMVPAGVIAYYVRMADEDIITLTRISRSMAIPAGEGVILIADNAGDYVMTEVERGSVTEATLNDNMLVGTCDKENTTLKSTDYVLTKKGSSSALAGQFTFCLVGNKTVTQPAHRAYLQMEAGASLVRMMFDGGETSVDDVLETTQDAVYYDLTGRRVANPVSGCVYIQNGKKVVK